MKIAFISDIHFGEMAISSEYSFEGEPLKENELENAQSSLKGLISILQKEEPQYLFVAGDLTSTGSPLEFDHCYKLITQIRDEIGVPEKNVLFCIGNHDVDWRITSVLDNYSLQKYKKDDQNLLEEQYTKMAKDIAKDILERESHQSLRPNYNEDSTILFSGVVEYLDCVVFVLNTAIKSSHLQEPKHGSLGNEQLKWFQEKAKEYAACEKPKICLLHHHPRLYSNYLPMMDESFLEEGGEFVQICGRNNISLVLHGHKHQPHAITQHETDWMTPVTFICAGSLSVNYSHRYQVIQNTFHVIDFKRKDHIELRNYSYSPHMGWSPTKYSDATPVDDTMLLGMTIDEEEKKAEIKKLPTHTLLTYEKLNDKLKYIPRGDLYREIKKIYADKAMITEEGEIFIMGV